MSYFTVHNRENQKYEILQVQQKPSHAGEILQNIKEVISYYEPDLEAETKRLQDLQDKVITIREGYTKKADKLWPIQRLFVRLFSRPNIQETAGKCLEAIAHQKNIVGFIKASNCNSSLECAKKFGYRGEDEKDAHDYISQLVLFDSFFLKKTKQHLYNIDLNGQHNQRRKDYDPNSLVSEAERLQNRPAVQALEHLSIAKRQG